MLNRTSVCIPVHNTLPRHLEHLLAGLESQVEYVKEVLVSDDSSEMSYDEVLTRFRETLPLKYIRHDAALGMVGNWNYTASRAEGEVVVMIGHDDLIAEGALKSYQDEFERNREVELVGGAVEFIDDEGRAVESGVRVNHRRWIFVLQPRYLLSGRDVTALCLRNGVAVGEFGAYAFRGETFRRIGGYDSAFLHAADLDLSIRLAQEGLTVYLNRPLLIRRVHDRNLTIRNLSAGIVSRERGMIFQKHSDSYSFTPRELDDFKAHLMAAALLDAGRAIKTGNLVLMRTAVRQAASHCDAGIRAIFRKLRELITNTNADRR